MIFFFQYTDLVWLEIRHREHPNLRIVSESIYEIMAS